MILLISYSYLSRTFCVPGIVLSMSSALSHLILKTIRYGLVLSSFYFFKFSFLFLAALCGMLDLSFPNRN